jgi:anti-sigma-K factor RskA
MNAINEEPEPQEIEALLPWYAAGTLSRRDANRVEQGLANDRELARQYDLVREELVETIHLNETLGAPSTRAIERLFAAIDAEEARAPRHRRWFDLGSRISEFLWSLTPRTLAWSATAAAVAILVQAAVIASVVVKEQGSASGPGLASAPNEGSYAVVRFAPRRPRMTSPTFLAPTRPSWLMDR